MAKNHFVLVIGEGFNRQYPTELSIFSLAAIAVAATLTRNDKAVLLLHKEVVAHPSNGARLYNCMQAELARRCVRYTLLTRESYNALTDARATFDFLNEVQGGIELTLVCYAPEVLLHQLRLYRRVLRFEYPTLHARLELRAEAAIEVPRLRRYETFLYSIWAELWRLSYNRFNYRIVTWLYSLATHGRVHGFVGTATPAGRRK